MKQRNTAVDLTDLAIGVMILGITVGIGARMLQLYANNQRTNLDTLTTSNEVTWINSTTDTLANTWVTGVTGCSNYTDGKAIVAANWTLSIDSVDGTGSLINATADNWQNVSCNYTRYDTTSRPDYTLANNATTGLAEFGNWFDIIVIVGVAGLILSLIFLAFGNKGQEAGVSY